MKKLICAAIVAGSMCAMADEAKCDKAACACPAPAAAEAAKVVPRRPQMTPEQKAEIKARREKFMTERKAKMEAQLLEVVKKYVPEEEKAKALIKELQDAMMAGRRMPMRPPRPAAAKPAEVK